MDSPQDLREVKEFMLNQISAFEPLGNHYALWLNNDDVRSAELSKTSTNAHVLYLVINHFIETLQSPVEKADLPSESNEEPDSKASAFGNLASSRFLSEKVKAESP